MLLVIWWWRSSCSRIWSCRSRTAFIDSCSERMRSSSGVRCSVFASLMRSGGSPTVNLALTSRGATPSVFLKQTEYAPSAVA